MAILFNDYLPKLNRKCLEPKVLLNFFYNLFNKKLKDLYFRRLLPVNGVPRKDF